MCDHVHPRSKPTLPQRRRLLGTGSHSKDDSSSERARHQSQCYQTSDNQFSCVRGWYRRMMDRITTWGKSTLRQLVSKFIDPYYKSSSTTSDKDPPRWCSKFWNMKKKVVEQDDLHFLTTTGTCWSVPPIRRIGTSRVIEEADSVLRT